MLVNVYSYDIDIIGIKKEHHVQVYDIMGDFVTFSEYITCVVEYFNDKKEKTFGNLNLDEGEYGVMEKCGIMTGNAIIPLYINKFHWKKLIIRLKLIF